MSEREAVRKGYLPENVTGDEPWLCILSLPMLLKIASMLARSDFPFLNDNAVL